MRNPSRTAGRACRGRPHQLVVDDVDHLQCRRRPAPRAAPSPAARSRGCAGGRPGIAARAPRRRNGCVRVRLGHVTLLMCRSCPQDVSVGQSRSSIHVFACPRPPSRRDPRPMPICGSQPISRLMAARIEPVAGILSEPIVGDLAQLLERHPERRCCALHQLRGSRSAAPDRRYRRCPAAPSRPPCGWRGPGRARGCTTSPPARRPAAAALCRSSRSTTAFGITRCSNWPGQ